LWILKSDLTTNFTWLTRHKTSQKHPFGAFAMNFLCCRITDLAHNLLSQRPALVSENLRPFIFALSGRLPAHKLKLNGANVPKSFPERLLEFFPGRFLHMDF